MKIRLIAVLALALVAGCLDREETIEIAPDGSCTLRVQAKGDPNDVRNGDALPSAAGGWKVQENSTRDAEGKETLTLTAGLTVPAGAPLPASYAPAGDPTEALALSFPTTVEIDPRPEGTYYHFRRVYRGREWRAIEYHRERLLETDEMKKIAEQDPGKCTPAERAALVRALIDFARSEASTYLHLAAADMKPALPQPAFLDALRAALAPLERPSLSTRATDLLSREASDEIVALAVQLQQEMKIAVEDSLRNSEVPESAVRAFVERCEFHHRRRDIASDLGDENWTVTVDLPGRIVGHNSLDAAGASNGGRVTWKFGGKALFDRDVVLMASSFVAKGEGRDK